MKIYEFPFKNSPYKVKLRKGFYLFEAWGACGAKLGGKGAYASGYIQFNETTNIYVFVGEKGKINSESFNGNRGCIQCSNGGGATDFRLVNNDQWDNFESLKSRIMVAAAGGGGDDHKGGDAGGLKGFVGESSPNTVTPSSPGTQTSEGTSGSSRSGQQINGYDGGFGIGASGSSKEIEDGGGGGGSGYYGGGGLPHVGGGSGGSSFVSGYPGCNAINEEADEPSQLTHSNQPIHYSGYYFTSPAILSGSDEMPSPSNSGTITGNSNDGYARIKLIQLRILINKCFSLNLTLIFIFILCSGTNQK